MILPNDKNEKRDKAFKENIISIFKENFEVIFGVK